MRPQVYEDPRPAECFERFHERARRRGPDWVYKTARLLLTPILVFGYRARCISSDNVPARGPAIIAPNHFSFLDHFFVGVYLRRPVQFMGKSQLFKWPQQFIFTHGGVFPVRRGQRDEEAFETARAVIARGGLVVMYAEGGRSRTGQLGKPRPGLGRLALETGAPVVATAIAGTQKARNWKRLQIFPKVTIQYGEPVAFDPVDDPTRAQAQAASEILFDRVEQLHRGLQRDGRRRAVRAARAARRAARRAAEGSAGPPSMRRA